MLGCLIIFLWGGCLVEPFSIRKPKPLSFQATLGQLFWQTFLDRDTTNKLCETQTGSLATLMLPSLTHKATE